jgi:glycosyltransferase involved in cell wall biosynthesis
MSESVSVVICTKDRHAILGDCLASLARQTRLPEEVLIVDASATPAEAQVETFRRAVGERCSTRLLRAEPGLTRQRNRGIDATSGSIVLFLDDDVVLEPDYVAEILAVYERDIEHAVGGVGGAIVPDPTPPQSAFHRAFSGFFLLPSYGTGRVKRSGHPAFLFNPSKETRVDFLAGCDMSYRREAIGGERFDERLTGYALGEDLEFSYRISRRRHLTLTPRARLDHREVGGGRPDHRRRNEMNAFNHYQFFRERVARRRLDWLAFAWAGLGRVLWILRHPGDGRLDGILHGYARVLRDALACSRRSSGSLRATGPLVLREAVAPWQPFVSVVVPVRNEAGFLGRCIDSILAQDYQAERIEVVVVENGSTDGTQALAAARAEGCDRVRLVTSDARNQAAAMNHGIGASRGDVIARVDGHSYLDPDYVQTAVAALARHPEAAGVGGPFLPAGETLVERVAGLARSSRIGVGGGYGADRAEDEHPVQTVQCGAYRREVLLTVGGFDVAMAYGEDEELNWRLLQRGYTIMLVPALRQYYRPRASLRALGRQYWNYGQGRVRVVRKHPGFLQPKHLAPSALVVTIVTLVIGGLLTPLATRKLAVLLGLYAVALAAAGLSTPARWRERMLLPFAVALMHLGYGTGMLWGLVDQRILRRLRRPESSQEEESGWQHVIQQPRSR